MLYLFTTGYGYSKKRCESIINWFYETQLNNKNIEIDVLHRGLKREGAYGWCGVYGKTNKPTEFLIEIQSNLDPTSYSTTLLHEMQHVKQFVCEDLKIKSGKRYYKGICVDELPYEDQEHEQEAHALEESLYEGYLTSLRKPCRLSFVTDEGLTVSN